MSLGQEERDAVLRVLDRGVLSGYQANWTDAFYGGPECRALEKEWQEYFGVKHAIACNSATSGLWAACAATGLKPGDEVICTPYSMTCSASIPLHFGAKPIFADIENDYFCLDPASIEQKITERTKAIIAVDLFGLACDFEQIKAIAKKHNIMVIEDAAQAAGAKYKGRYAGTLGDIGVYSLNVNKPIQCGEGGIVVTDNDDLAMKVRLLCNHAESVINDMVIKGSKPIKQVNYRTIPPLDSVGLVGMNLRMVELSAAVAREQLKKLAGIIKKKQEHAKYFPVEVRPYCKSSFYRYAFTGGNDLAERCDIGLTEFNHKKHYITPLFKLPLFKNLGYDQEQCPVSQRVEENICLAWLKE